ncbi:phage tail protein [Buttiauxella brennerae ATCC 51605]|uniref:Phage tail protein n=1 Tax=Buttiauxella brennerae ATCC 51605 TaxID=1354251 RepID=A0A1B7IQT7_9ENTR|nr:phage tail protein [Buttiauxella brennerae]OAT32116.1 phage tail protein [Buttiauxella brennerae ATCC 51605]
MKKPDSLRRALTEASSHLRENPDSLHIFVDDGSVVSTLAPSLSWEYRYTLNVMVTEFSGDQNLLMAALLAWVHENQPDIMANPDLRNNGFTFEAVIINHTTCDISIDLRLTERVVMTPSGENMVVEAVPEPENPELRDDYWLTSK